jgi:hypothetical protein
MSIDDTPRLRRQWAGAAVVLVTALWLLGMAVVVYLSLVAAMSPGTHQEGGADDLGRDAWHMSIWLAAVTVGGPVLAAGIARTGGLVKTAVGYGVLAALLAVPATVLVLGAHPGTPRTADEPARAPQACQERSGGDSHCPGG